MRVRERETVSVEVLDDAALARLSTDMLALRRGDLLACASTRARAEALRILSRELIELDERFVVAREDPRFAAQYAAVKAEQARRRLERREPIWCVTANVVRERRYGPGGLDIERASKHLRGGQKVFVFACFGGMCESVEVLGRRRGGGAWTHLVLRAEHLERFRPALVHKPAVVDAAVMFARGRQRLFNEVEARAYASAFPLWGRRATLAAP